MSVGLAGLFELIGRTAPIGLETSAGEVRERLSAPRLELGTDTLIGVDADGAVRGYAEAADMGVGNGQFRIRLTCALPPGSDGGTALDWLTGRAQSMRRERHPDLPGVCSVRCAGADQARIDALTAAGFVVDHWHLEMRRAVTPAVSGSAAPDGVVVMRYEPRYSEPTTRTRCCSARRTGRGPEVAAFVCSLAQPGEGVVHVLGTRQGWRGRWPPA